ncbi:MAG: hypothetical protein DWG76_04380 [Chloroflexi bacterium]|nr:hypothetical protein [Chloroflexota bacterium]
MDLITGQEIILRQGRVKDAVMATIAVPGIFPPQTWGEYELVDGGMSNPVPVSVARGLAPGLPVVAVVLSKPPEQGVELPFTNPLSPIPVLERISRLRLAQAFNTFARSVLAGGRLLTEMRLAVEKPEVIIRPDVDHVGLLERVDVHEIVQFGEEAARRQLGEITALEGWPSKMVGRLNLDRFFKRRKK